MNEENGEKKTNKHAGGRQRRISIMGEKDLWLI